MVNVPLRDFWHAYRKIGLEHSMFRRFTRSISGATSLEYALIASLVSVAIVVGATSLGSNTEASYTHIENQITGSTK